MPARILASLIGSATAPLVADGERQFLASREADFPASSPTPPEREFLHRGRPAQAPSPPGAPACHRTRVAVLPSAAESPAERRHRSLAPPGSPAPPPAAYGKYGERETALRPGKE